MMKILYREILIPRRRYDFINICYTTDTNGLLKTHITDGKESKMREIKTRGIICVKDKVGFEYELSEIEYIEREDETYEYIFTPNYCVMDLLPNNIFQGIPGLNLELRKDKYVRKNMTPVFISERTPGAHREDLWELLSMYDMDYLNRLEWLIRTDMTYSGDPMYVKRYIPEEYKVQVDLSEKVNQEKKYLKVVEYMLKEICKGNDLIVDDVCITDENRKQMHAMLMKIYTKSIIEMRERRREGIEKAKKAGKYKGRTPIEIDVVKMDEVFTQFNKRMISEVEAIKKLGVSKSTFYRRLKKYNHS